MKHQHIAICPGSFDPPSFGHINIIKRALKVFDKLVVAIAESNTKSSLFTVNERKEILAEIFKNEKCIEIDNFSGLLVDYAHKRKINTFVRGIRTVADYEYELQMSLANRMLDPETETVFIMTEGKYSHISSTIIKQVIKLGGSGKEMVHPFVEKKLKAKLFPKK